MERLGDNAHRLLAAAGAPGAAELSAVTTVWTDCVGETIARAAWPSRLSRDGTLHVATVSSTWAFELGRLAGEITERLQAALAADSFSALRFAPGPVPEPGRDAEEEAPAVPAITSRSRLEGERLASGIQDAELRDLVARAAAASLERARSDRGFC
jgi:hypothetical protein